MMPAQPVDGDAHVSIVRGFQDTSAAWQSMGNVTPGEDAVLAAWLQRHAWRATRNKHRIDYAQRRLLLSRSVNKWGSEQAANVAAMRVAAPRTLMDDFLRRPSVDVHATNGTMTR